MKPSGRFERDTTTEQLRAMGGEEAANLSNVISMYGYAGQAAAAGKSAAAAPAAGAVGDSARKGGVPSTSGNPTKDTSVQPTKEVRRVLPPPGGAAKQATPPTKASGGGGSSSKRRSGGSMGGGIPIIIVPAGRFVHSVSSSVSALCLSVRFYCWLCCDAPSHQMRVEGCLL